MPRDLGRAAVCGCADLSRVVGVSATIMKNYGLSGADVASVQDKIQLTARNAVPFSCTSYNTTQLTVYTLTFSRSASVANITIRSALSSHDVICTLDVSSVWSSWQQLEGVNINNTGDTFVVPSV